MPAQGARPETDGQGHGSYVRELEKISKQALLPSRWRPARLALLEILEDRQQDVVPHLQHLGVVPEAAPDLTRPDAGVPALTLVFDREGWSPACSSVWPGVAFYFRNGWLFSPEYAAASVPALLLRFSLPRRRAHRSRSRWRSSFSFARAACSSLFSRCSRSTALPCILR